MAAIFCYVTDRASLPAPNDESLLAVLRRAISAGVDWIQIREKDLSGRELAALAREAVSSARGSSTQVIVNGRFDVAIAARAGGVHLGGDALPIGDVVAWCAQHVAGSAKAGLKAAPTSFLVGASCHSLNEAWSAERDGAQYITFGPVFATPAKAKFGPPQGLARLEEVCRAVRLPVLAIGGVTQENAQECLRAGAAGIAAIRMFQECEDLAGLIRKLRSL